MHGARLSGMEILVVTPLPNVAVRLSVSLMPHPAPRSTSSCRVRGIGCKPPGHRRRWREARCPSHDTFAQATSQTARTTKHCTCRKLALTLNQGQGSWHFLGHWWPWVHRLVQGVSQNTVCGFEPQNTEDRCHLCTGHWNRPQARE